MKTFDDYQKAQRAYRSGVTTLLSMGGIPDCVPATEREWVLFNTNQKLRDMGVGKPLPWPDRPPVDWSADEVADAMTRAVTNMVTR